MGEIEWWQYEANYFSENLINTWPLFLWEFLNEEQSWDVSFSVGNLKKVGEYNSWNVRTKMKSWIKQGIRQTRTKMKSWVNQCIRQTLSIKKEKSNLFVYHYTNGLRQISSSFLFFWLMNFFIFLSRVKNYNKNKENEDTSKKNCSWKFKHEMSVIHLKLNMEVRKQCGKTTLWQVEMKDRLACGKC